jgi:hypothetical protein
VQRWSKILHPSRSNFFVLGFSGADCSLAFTCTINCAALNREQCRLDMLDASLYVEFFVSGARTSADRAYQGTISRSSYAPVSVRLYSFRSSNSSEEHNSVCDLVAMKPDSVSCLPPISFV